MNFNCYQEGYNDGMKDAMNGKSKNYTGFPKLKSFVTNDAYDSYVNGYNKGYSDGLAKKSGVYR
jgi:hypothetical protein